MNQVTKISYEYRDASHYGAYRAIFVSGILTPEQKSVIDDSRSDGEFFIPTQVGLAALQPELLSFPSEDDHVWHRIDTDDFIVMAALPADETLACTAQEFADRFKNVEWDVAKEYERLGLDDID